MTANDCLRDARACLALHGLHGWTVRIDNAKARMGSCRHFDRVLTFSRYHLAADMADVIKHEVAHALAGPGHGHGRVWLAACRVTGARPERCGTGAPVAHAHTLRCEACGAIVGRHKLTKRFAMAIAARELYHLTPSRTRCGVLEKIQIPGGASCR